jgi:hypothetical protein
MKAQWAYFWYVCKHKWFVARGCRLLGVSAWQAVIHDWVKFLPVEFVPYVHQFYNHDGSKRSVRDASGAYDPNQQSTAFQYAWLHHQRQKHHWQAWISIGDGGNLSALPIPTCYVREMVADWYGAGMAISGKNDVEGWYYKNKDKIILHPAARVEVEATIQELMLKVIRTLD